MYIIQGTMNCFVYVSVWAFSNLLLLFSHAQSMIYFCIACENIRFFEELTLTDFRILLQVH